MVCDEFTPQVGGGELGEKISDITSTGTKVAEGTSGGGGHSWPIYGPMGTILGTMIHVRLLASFLSYFVLNILKLRS